MTARHQHVVVEGEKSTAAHVLSGVPQGSILGPLLFLVYIDDINNMSLSPGACRVIFADDVCIYRPICCQADYECVQDDISATDHEQWSSENFLTLNPSKCIYMLISKKRSPTLPDIPLLLHKLPLCQVDTFKYLGLLLSEDLSWSPHINAICSKARQVLGLLYRRFITSLTQTHLFECTHLWYVPILNMLALYGRFT